MHLLNVLNKSAEYTSICETLKRGVSPVSVVCSNAAQKAHFIASVMHEKSARALVVSASDYEARMLFEDLKFFAGMRTCLFTSKDYIYYEVDSVSRETAYARLRALKHITEREDAIAVTSIEALLQYTVPPELFKNTVLSFELGAVFNLETLCIKLIELGYERCDTVEGIGQFSMRGGILDVFSPNYDEPVRIEFFDDEVDSIRFFDVGTQVSIEKTESAEVIACREALYTPQRRDAIVEALKKELKKYAQKGDEAYCARISADIESFTEKLYFASVDRYINRIYPQISTVLDYFSGAVIFVDEPKTVSQNAKATEIELSETLTDLMERALILPKTKGLWAEYKTLVQKMNALPMLTMSAINASSAEFRAAASYNLMSRSMNSFHGKMDFLTEDLRDYHQKKATVLVLAGASARAESFSTELNNNDIECVYIKTPETFHEGILSVSTGSISGGFEYPDIRFALISDREVFQEKKRRSGRGAKPDGANKLRSFTDIQPGDYVVHQAHGIGRYDGIAKLTVDGVTKDYLKVSYHGTDNLYVPVDQLDMLYKYIGGTGKTVKVNRLGGTDWNKTKARVKASASDLAQHLIRLYGERSRMQGFAFSEDTPWQREFEDGFAYSETPDQLRSIEEVKKDMESTRPMDRLLCGDVGYGKTEVAIRAAFKAVMDSKQVAYLVPTTILAMQHYHTFMQRMQNFPIKVEMLSRFRTAAEQKKIIQKLKTGEVDVIIGTHRILQKDLEFRDLGLLIIDEEQRFGVAHKEKLKEIRKNVDVLTLSATPIPRTLHMAMVNIRDMSVISQPPQNRYPVQTYVMEHDENVLVEAIKKELARGGQVYYLYNKVNGIHTKASHLQTLIPEARVGVGHGKMGEDALERVMMDFMEGETNVLVCTTIIETGLDISNVNTIIIENADKMGLSQLYQLRGRVGRSNRLAYAYLTYSKSLVMSEIAQKRLSAVREFTEFGSGFKIAMRDLEIRGAGNLLGEQQHGHMDAVGYDMYCKLLKESVDELSGKAPEEQLETAIDFHVNAHIPESYIRSQETRIDMYKRIAAISDLQDRYAVEEELEDRFGDIPTEVCGVLDVALVKAYAKDLKITEISEKDDNVLLRFDAASADMTLVLRIVGEYNGQILFSAGERPYLSYKAKKLSSEEKLQNIKFILQRMKELQFS